MKLELNRAQTKVTKLLRLILTISVAYASCERLSSALKHMNSEERLSNLVFIFLNKDLLKKMKGCGAYNFYSQVIDEFAKKKRIDLLTNFNNSLSLDFIIFSHNQ